MNPVHMRVVYRILYTQTSEDIFPEDYGKTFIEYDNDGNQVIFDNAQDAIDYCEEENRGYRLYYHYFTVEHNN